MMSKHFIVLVCFLVSLVSIQAQDQTDEMVFKNQVSTNASYLITGTPDINYERALGKRFAIGIGGSLFSNFYRSLEIPNGGGTDYNLEYEITPFARWYINSIQTKSHFIEIYMSINGGEEVDEIIRITNPEGFGVYVRGIKEVSNVGLGGAYGYRFLLLENKLVLEASIGLRTNFNRDNYLGLLDVAIARTGVKVGYRF